MERDKLLAPKTVDPSHEIAALVKTAKTYYSSNEHSKAIEYAEKALNLDPANIDALHILSYSNYYKENDLKAIEYCTSWVARDIRNPALPLAVLQKIYERKAIREEQARQQEKQARLLEQAKLQERNKVIADLSHSIKNLLSTVTDPLENLKQSAGVDRRIIENALRGANLVREIVNGMNLSSQGSIDDFYYDAAHNTGINAANLKTILINALKYSVANMFDGKYFSSFMRKYFPSKECYVEAKSQWEQVSLTHDTEIIMAFLQHYFFDTEIIWDDAERLVMGNDKGSATKFLILFQEILLNAVKYSAFVEREQRILKSHFSTNTKRISITVQNRFNVESRVKTSGIGHVIIENFAERISTRPIVEKRDNIYSMMLTCVNFWERPPG